MSELILDFIEHIEVERGRSSKTAANYEHYLQRFVEFADEANNQKAVDQLDGKDLDGRTINVSLARPKEDRPRRDFGGNDRGGNGGGNGGGSFRQRSW